MKSFISNMFHAQRSLQRVAKLHAQPLRSSQGLQLQAVRMYSQDSGIVLSLLLGPKLVLEHCNTECINVMPEEAVFEGKQQIYHKHMRSKL